MDLANIAINWKCHPYGSGSQAYGSRKIVAQLRALGARVGIENVRPWTQPPSSMGSGELDLIDELCRVHLDPAATVHVRNSPVASPERGLIEGAFDPSPIGRNVWFRSVDLETYLQNSPYDFLPWVDQIWTVSEHSRSALVASGVPESLVRVVPRGVDVDIFRPEASPQAHGKFRFLHSSNTAVWERKAVDVMLRAFVIAFSASADVELVLHTRGKYSVGHWHDLIARYAPDRTANVHVVRGYLDEREMAGLYHSADCYLNPCRAEALGLTNLEAMASGLPVILVGWGGPLDFADRATAILVDYDLVPWHHTVGREPSGARWAEPRVDSLVEAMRTVVADGALRESLARAAVERAQSWTWKAAAQKVVVAAEEVLQ